MLPSHLTCPGQWLDWSDQRGLPWLVRQQEATGNGARPWLISDDDREQGLLACADAIEALDAIAALLPEGADVLPPARITSWVGQQIMQSEPRRFSRIRLGTRKAVFEGVRKALVAAQQKRERDVNLDQLFANILAKPHDDDARLVFADALGATDADAAEFIVTQIERRRVLRAGGSEDPARLAREADLLTRYGHLWSNGIGHHASRYEFRGGFVECIELDASTLVRDAALIFARAPIRHLILTGRERVIDALRLPQLEHLVALELLTWDAFDALGEGPPSLRVLDLRRLPSARRAPERLPRTVQVVLPGQPAPSFATL